MVKLISARKIKQAEPTEHEIQSALFSVLQQYEDRIPEWKAIYAIPNGAKLPWNKDNKGRRYSVEAKGLLKEGMKPGTPDICCPYSDGTFSALYIEMKRANNDPSPAQVERISLLRSLYNEVVIARSMEMALDIILIYTIRRYEHIKSNGKILILLRQIQQNI